MTQLRGAAVRYLRALGHPLKPVVQLGKAGLNENVVRATAATLTTHELVKVKVQPECPLDRHEAAEALAAATDAALVQVLGRTFLLFRRNPERRKIVLPGEKPLEEKTARKVVSLRARKGKGRRKEADGPARDDRGARGARPAGTFGGGTPTAERGRRAGSDPRRGRQSSSDRRSSR